MLSSLSDRLGWLVLTAAVALVIPGVAAAEPDPLAEIETAHRELFQRLAPSVVYITTARGIGSGFFVSDRGLILTNSHVVHGTDRPTVILHGGKKLAGKVIERAADGIDLALVQVAIDRSPPLELATGEIDVGDFVASVGHGVDSPWTYTVGMVSNIYPSKADRPVFQTQIPLNPGSSGSPIADRSGRVVGIATAGIKQASSVNFAIRSPVALRSLAGLAATCRCLVIEVVDRTPVFVDGKLAGKGPRVIVPVADGEHEVTAVIGGKLRKHRVDFPHKRRIDLR